MEFLNPAGLLNLAKWLWDQIAMWRIRRYAPSARRVRLVVALTRSDYEAIPSNLKEGIMFLQLPDQPPDQGNGSPDPDSQEKDELDDPAPSAKKGE